MFEYQVHQQRSAELIRRADRERLAREVVRARRAAARPTTENPERTPPRHHDPHPAHTA